METVARMSEDGGRFITPLINVAASPLCHISCFLNDGAIWTWLHVCVRTAVVTVCVFFFVGQSPRCGPNSWSRSQTSPCSYTRVDPTSQQPFQDTWYPSLSDISLIRTIRCVSELTFSFCCNYKFSSFFCSRGGIILVRKTEKEEKNKPPSLTGLESLFSPVSSRCGRPAKQHCSSSWNRAYSPKLTWRPKLVQFCLNWPNPAVTTTTKSRQLQ